jgi:hypothetical protein
MTAPPNNQTNPVAALPVRLSTGSSFYVASGGGPVVGGTPLGYQQISAATLAAAQSLTLPVGATSAVVQAEGGDVRWRDDGVSPTNSIGMILYQGMLPIVVGDPAAIMFIRSTNQTGATLNVSYYK